MPQITTPPASSTVCEGQPVTFTVVAQGAAPLTYQWRNNAVAIPGATADSYAITAATAADAGSYDVVVSNATFAATSPAATLAVFGRGDANCDGVIDFFDIDPLLAALFDPSGYAAAYCGGNNCAADVNCSGFVDFFDIDPFLDCLFNGCVPCP